MRSGVLHQASGGAHLILKLFERLSHTLPGNTYVDNNRFFLSPVVDANGQLAAVSMIFQGATVEPSRYAGVRRIALLMKRGGWRA